MDILLTKFSQVVNGVITGFDRIVFKGMLRRLMFAKGMQVHLMQNHILNKDFKEYVTARSKAIVADAERLCQESCGREVTYLASGQERKEALAHRRQEETGCREGLIGVWSSLETCRTFRSSYNPSGASPVLRPDRAKCKHLYFYFDDPAYGFMSIRLQTWAPYEIQVAMNGREWLKKGLDAQGCGYFASGNKFLHIEDYGLAQELLEGQKAADYQGILDSLVPRVFPRMPEIVGEKGYYWTVWQSELAKDYIFKDKDELWGLMGDFQKYALCNGTGERILKYFGAPVKADGQPHKSTSPEVVAQAGKWQDGLRVKHWDGKNSVKFYNEQNVLRFEATVNDPTRYKIYRHTQKQGMPGEKRRQPMRKGIADISARAEVSQEIAGRFAEHVAEAENRTPLWELLKETGKAKAVKGKRVRGLDVLGKDLEFLRAISDPSSEVEGITNKGLQKKLEGTAWAKGKTQKQLSGRISRHLSLLRGHGIIRKLPNQRKYVLTTKGAQITTCICVVLSASTNDLLKLAA